VSGYITTLYIFNHAQAFAGESDFVPAARVPTPTPVVTRSDDVSKSLWNSHQHMVLTRGQARGNEK